MFAVLPLLAACAPAHAQTERFVSLSGGHSSPFTSWTTAATNIHAAVGVSGDSDVIWVTNGLYLLTNTVTVTAGITLRSVNGPDFTAINGMGMRAFSINNAGAVLRGFTITNGFHATAAGAALLQAGTMEECLIASCFNALQIMNGSLVRDCRFVANPGVRVVRVVAGGGVLEDCLFHGHTNDIVVTDDNAAVLLMNRCEISGNNLHGKSAIYTGFAESVVISNSVISGNTGEANWAPLRLSAGQRTMLWGCAMSGNTGGFGGGLYIGNTNTSIENCSIISNRSTSHYSAAGGVVLGGSGNAKFRNCVIAGNYNGHANAGGPGAVLLQNTARAFFENCTVAYNATLSTQGPGALVLNDTSAAGITNCIIYYNIGTGGREQYYPGASAALSIGWSCSSQAPTPAQDMGNNTTNAPLFAAQGTGYGLDWAGGNPRLIQGSPCINRGFNMDWMTGAVDLDGNPRLQLGAVDMGAYEYIPQGTIFLLRGK